MPAINIPDKVCPHCNGTMWLVRKSTSSNNNRYTCSLQNLERFKEWKENNPEKYKETCRKKALKKKLHKEQNPVPRKKKTFTNHLPEEQLKDILLKFKSDNVYSTKTCNKCNKEKNLSSFKIIVRKTGKVYTKPTCDRCYQKRDINEYRIRRNENSRLNFKNRSDEQRIKLNLFAANWRKNNPDKIKIIASNTWNFIKFDPIKREKKNKLHRIHSRKKCESLSDEYITSRIIGKKGIGILYKKDILQELIDMKRTQLLLKRQII
jgi:transposase-like protein